VEIISECVEAQSSMGPLGYRYLAQGDPWELMVYPTPVELVGGADDGAVVNPGFSLDLQALLAHFDRVEAFQWYPIGLGPYDTEGPCVSIEGLYQGHDERGQPVDHGGGDVRGNDAIAQQRLSPLCPRPCHLFASSTGHLETG